MKYKILLLSIALFFTTFINAQTKTSVIQTSAECGSCKIRIEDKLNYTKGIKFSELNLKDKKVKVKYSTKKISLDQIKKVISEKASGSSLIFVKTVSLSRTSKFKV